MELTNKVIVITGASSGAGRTAALEFAQHNTCLVLAARNENALNEVADECRGLGSLALVVVTDVTDPKAMINLANAAKDWMGKVDVWINNAGILGAGEFDITPMEVHEQIVRTNLLGYMNGAHAILPLFKEQGYGTIINNISIGGFLPVPYGAGYSASKFGLRGFSEALKAELVTFKNIHICDLFPAFLDTPGIYHAANYTGKELKPAPPVYDPKRVAEAMLKLAADPTSNTYVGSAALLLKFSHAILPELTTKLTGFVMRRYLNNAKEIYSTSGNAFNTVDFGMSTHGGFSIPGEPKVLKKYLTGALVLGLVAGYVFTARSK